MNGIWLTRLADDGQLTRTSPPHLADGHLAPAPRRRANPHSPTGPDFAHPDLAVQRLAHSHLVDARTSPTRISPTRICSHVGILSLVQTTGVITELRFLFSPVIKSTASWGGVIIL